MPAMTEKEQARVAEALITLTEWGVPPDVQELLLYGNPNPGFEVRPGALLAVINRFAE